MKYNIKNILLIGQLASLLLVWVVALIVTQNSEKSLVVLFISFLPVSIFVLLIVVLNNRYLKPKRLKNSLEKLGKTILYELGFQFYQEDSMYQGMVDSFQLFVSLENESELTQMIIIKTIVQPQSADYSDFFTVNHLNSEFCELSISINGLFRLPDKPMLESKLSEFMSQIKLNRLKPASD